MSSKLSREAFASAMKRKDVKELGAIILREVFDDPEAAELLEAATRITVPLIDKTCGAARGENKKIDRRGHGDEPGEPEETEDTPETDEKVGGGEVASDETLNIGEIKALLEKGDKKSVKKAKKAFEAQFAEDHPNYKELKKLIKAAKKALEK